ncbi:HDL371Wp [Eremothecium sinecaudum]|uniref:HDL371Wp n=1 Tax=Eremothecium sinecaudum TaxID=45286 RepID=A0A120K244_9SACH|nr:HDL371Wp [Eremothecium sinecaudum]AMD20373.1 HDL371Wp [Eremothecium sinecaudum]
MRFSRLAWQQLNKTVKNEIPTGILKRGQNKQNLRYSKTSLASNIGINALFGMGLYWLYKDYTQKIPSETGNKTGPTANKPTLFGEDIKDYNELVQTLGSLSYGDLSFMSVSWAFLGYFTSVAGESFGKKTLVSRSLLFLTLMYPPLQLLLVYRPRYRRRLQHDGERGMKTTHEN